MSVEARNLKEPFLVEPVFGQAVTVRQDLGGQERASQCGHASNRHLVPLVPYVSCISAKLGEMRREGLPASRRAPRVGSAGEGARHGLGRP